MQNVLTESCLFVCFQFQQGIPRRTSQTFLMTAANHQQVSLQVTEISASHPTWWQTDVLILCFPVNRPETLHHIQDNIKPLLLTYYKHKPIVLVGTKVDLMHDPNYRENMAYRDIHPIAVVQAKALADEIHAVDYIECSAKTDEGLNELFAKVTELALIAETSKTEPEKSSNCCNIL